MNNVLRNTLDRRWVVDLQVFPCIYSHTRSKLVKSIKSKSDSRRGLDTCYGKVRLNNFKFCTLPKRIPTGSEVAQCHTYKDNSKITKYLSQSASAKPIIEHIFSRTLLTRDAKYSIVYLRIWHNIGSKRVTRARGCFWDKNFVCEPRLPSCG